VPTCLSVSGVLYTQIKHNAGVANEESLLCVTLLTAKQN